MHVQKANTYKSLTVANCEWWTHTHTHTRARTQAHARVRLPVVLISLVNCFRKWKRKWLRWSRGNVLAFGTQVHGFAPGRSLPSFGGEVKPSVPCRSFTACKRSLNVTWRSAFRQNYRTFLAHSSTFQRWVLSHGDTSGDAWWRKVERLTKIAQ